MTGSPDAAAAAVRAAPHRNAAIPVALSTGSVYTFGTARAFELAARCGYDGVEVIVDDRWDTRQPAYLRRLTAETGVPVLSVHSPFGAVSAWPRDEVERVRRSLEVAEAVGARTLNVHVPFRVHDLSVVAGVRRLFSLPVLPVSEHHRTFRRWLTEGGLAAQQARTAVTIAVENLPVRRLFGRRFNPYALNTWEALAAFPRLCLDTTHCGTTGADLLAVYERLAGSVVHVHLSDYTGRYQHQPVGTGQLPLGPFLERLRARGYGGIVVVELTPRALPVQDEGRLAAELGRNLAFCRQHLQGAAAAAAARDGAAAPPAAPVPS